MAELARLISSPRSLLIFEAVARHGSFSRAAQDFNISQPSVSRNIAQLERDLGLPLFVRGAKGVVLTPAGKELFAVVSDGVTRIAEVVTTLRDRGQKAGNEVILSLSNAFVTNWLTLRLSQLSAAFPQATLRFELVAGTRTSVPEEVDLATLITSGAEAPGLALAPEVIVPVCSPAYLETHGVLTASAGHRFLHLSDHDAAVWDPVLGAGAAARAGAVWHSFSDYAAIIQAAMDGTGIALGWLSVVASSLRSGRLVPAWQGGWIETGRTIRLLSTRPGPMRPLVRDIADWLCARMDEDLEALAAQGLGPLRRRNGAADSVAGGLHTVSKSADLPA